MNSKVKIKPSYRNNRLKEYIRVKNRRIPIYKAGEDEDGNVKLQYVERFLRYYEEYIRNEDLVFLSNYLYHEISDCLEYNQFEREIRKQFSLCNNIQIYYFQNIEDWNEKGNFVNEKTTILQIDNKEKERIYILFEENKTYVGLSKEKIVLQSYERNRKAVGEFSLKERECYECAERTFKFGEKEKELSKVISTLMLCFPMYLYGIQKEVVQKDLWKETFISRVYHENSKLRIFHQQGDFMKPSDEINDEIKKFTAKGRKLFPQHERIKLPKADKSSGYSIEEVVLNRRTRRKYCNEAVSKQKFSNILYYSYGITGRLDKTDLMLRAVPSGGGLYPVDIYISVNYVEGLEKGIYYYDPLEHELVLVNKKDLSQISKEISGYAEMLDTAAFTFLLGANFWRNQWKYYERGYRVILLDCGHVAQNLHMMATAYNLGSCCLMGFIDDEINKLLELDGIVENAMYLITVGVNRKE